MVTENAERIKWGMPSKGPNILAVYEIWWQFGRGVNNARW